MKKAVLSLSGGLDSSCTLAHLLTLPEYDEVRTYSFKYGQRHQHEIKKAQKIVALLRKKGYNVTHNVIDLTSAFADSASSLCFHGEIPEGHYADETMKSTVVENRNIIFSSIIFGKALSLYKKALKTETPVEGVDIVLGVHAGDHTIYPDCKPASVNMARELYKISNWDGDKIGYNAMFVNSTKGEVLQAGVNALKKLGFTEKQIDNYLSNTLTCYNPNEKHESCGKCGSCTERLEAFEFVGRKDPVKYVTAVAA